MVQIDFLFFVLLVPYARGTNIYIWFVLFFVDRRGRIERKGCFGMGGGREGLTGWN